MGENLVAELRSWDWTRVHQWAIKWGLILFTFNVGVTKVVTVFLSMLNVAVTDPLTTGP